MLFFLVEILLFFSSRSRAGAAGADDATVLLNLKATINDPFKYLTSWNTNTSICQWNGISCSGFHGQLQVSSLTLQLLEFLKPTALAFVLQELPRLHTLSISMSNFTGSLENTTLDSCHLEVLNISRSQLTGGIPVNLLSKCKSLQKLDLSHNKLFGTLPPEVFQTCKLVSLDLSSNLLSGSVPPEMLINCKVLREVNLAYNNFSGEFPAGLVVDIQSHIQKLSLASNSFTQVRVTCSNLVELDVSSNKLSDLHMFTSPRLGSCLSLKFLNISHNAFSGSFSSLLDLKSMPSLALLDGSHNHFNRMVPSFHAELQFLNLSSNNFDNVGMDLCSADGRTTSSSKLRSLLLPNNKLAGPVLGSILNCTSLEMLDLSFNSITGELPEDVCDRLPSLQHLLLWMNDFEGEVPSGFSRCMNLSTVILSYNRFQGIIPHDISLVKNLWWLSLSSNQLTGTIPRAFGQMTNIQVLQLANNSLEGEIPAELAGCKNLFVLDLGGNLLSGPVPGRIGRNYTGLVKFGDAPVVNTILGNSRLVRPLFHKCKGREMIFLLQGIPLELLNDIFKRRAPTCQWNILPGTSSLLIFSASYNRLTGHVPPGLGTMQSLFFLELAHNMLEGPLPNELGELRAIQMLDVSENMLSGRIPESIAMLTFMFSLNVSYNNLSGLIPQKGQFNTFPASSFQGNPGLYGFPLPVKQQVSGGVGGTNADYDEGNREEVLVGIGFSIVSFAVSCSMVLFFDTIVKTYGPKWWKKY